MTHQWKVGTMYFKTRLVSYLIIKMIRKINMAVFRYLCDLSKGMGLLDVVKAVKPNILIGLSTCGGLFSGNVILIK